MTVKPVKRSQPPDYPHGEYAKIHPELLERLPERWRKCRQAALAAGLVLSMSVPLSACRTEPPRTAGIPAPPEMLGEAEAIKCVLDAAGPLFRGAEREFPWKAAGKALTYVQYDEAGKSYVEVALTFTGEARAIDAFDSGKGVGFEYLGAGSGSEGEPQGVSATGKEIGSAGQDSGWVLVLNEEQKDDPGAEDRIRAQVVAFLDWLKAEGVI